MTSRDIIEALRKHWGESAVLVTEVANGTGSNARRHMDALALGCWPSRGLFVYAIEVKVSRGDLLRELCDPSKADAIARYCDRMFLATPKGLVEDPNTLPDAWGLLEVSDKGVHARKAAQQIESAPLDRTFLMAVIRAAVKQHSDESRIAKLVEAARSKGYSEGSADSERNRERTEKRAVELSEELSALRHALGHHRPELVGQAVRAIQSLRGDYGALNSLRVDARKILEQADALQKLAREVLAEEGNAAE